MADKFPYKAITAPCSEDKDFFEEASTFDEALELYKNRTEKYYSAELREFKTQAELEAYVQGFDDGVGWLGDETVITNT